MNKEYTNTRLKSNIVHLSDPKLICIHTMEINFRFSKLKD